MPSGVETHRSQIVGVAAVCLLGFAAPAHADKWSWGPESPFQLDGTTDTGLIALGVPLWLMPHFYDVQLDPPSCGTATTAACDLSKVPWFDRPFMYSNSGLRPAGDFMLTYGPLIAMPLLFLDYGPARWRDYLTDLTIIFESWAWSGAMTHMFRYAVRRPRPYLYTSVDTPNEPNRNDADATMSFPAGHVSETVGFGVALAYTITVRHGLSWRSVAAWTGVALFGLTMSVLRIGSGDHFLSDTVVGTLIGVSSGVLVPRLHRRVGSATVAIAPLVSSDMGGVSLAGHF